MLKKATNGFWVLIGLALGVVIAYQGLKVIFVLGMKVMRHEAQETFSFTEIRLQRMTDAALKLEKVMSDLGWKGSKRSFLEAEHLRSLLAGHEELSRKAEWAVELEHQLLDSQDLWEHVGAASPRISGSYYFQEHVRWWTNESRWLAREEAETRLAFEHYNRTIRRFPFSLFARDYAAKIVAQGVLNAARNKPAMEGVPAAAGVSATAAALVEPLPVLTFEDQEPWPEEYYAEVQYRPMPSQLRMEEGEQDPQLERDQNRKAFEKIKILEDKKDIIPSEEIIGGKKRE